MKSSEHKCPSYNCTETLQHRNGKFGGFWYCRHHGTISDRGMAILTAGCIISGKTSGIQSSIDVTDSNSDLLFQIKRETAAMGFGVSDLEEWVVDGNPNDVDHWSNDY